MKKLGTAAITTLIIASPLLALAQGGIPPVTPPDDPNLIANTISKVLGFAFGFLLVIAALFIIYAAYIYLTSGGDEDKVKSAKNYILYAVVAIVVGFLAQGIVALTENILGI